MKAALALLAVFGMVLSPVVADDAGQGPKFKITSQRDDDTVTLRTDKAAIIFDIKSPKGISTATIERTAEKWPDVVLRLHTRGLEGFGVSHEKLKLRGAVSVQREGPRTPLSKEDEKEDSKAVPWGEIVAIGSDGKPTDNRVLKDGYFEVRLSKAFFEGNPKKIEVHWIDFYRR
ncbi:MAG: hypothetical protein U0792_09215 [Gemmataceae bacterium]